MSIKPKPGHHFVLRTCEHNMHSSYGFFWPESGPVECSDWDPKPKCGHGLHGLLHGEGDGSLLDWDLAAKWLIVEVENYTDLDGRVKFERGNVVYCGDHARAVAILQEVYPDAAVVGGTATAGYGGIATAGYQGKAAVGNYGTATVGDYGKVTVGDHSTATAGYQGIATAGYQGKAEVGGCGTATVGNRGTAMAGDCGIATAGYRGTVTAGGWGKATVGEYGVATAGDWGIIQIHYCDSDGRERIKTGYIGEDGLLPNVPYRLDDNHNFVRVG